MWPCAGWPAVLPSLTSECGSLLALPPRGGNRQPSVRGKQSPHSATLPSPVGCRRHSLMTTTVWSSSQSTVRNTPRPPASLAKRAKSRTSYLHCSSAQRNSGKGRHLQKRWMHRTLEKHGSCGSKQPSTAAAERHTSGSKGRKLGHLCKWLSTACTELHHRPYCKLS